MYEYDSLKQLTLMGSIQSHAMLHFSLTQRSMYHSVYLHFFFIGRLPESICIMF